MNKIVDLILPENTLNKKISDAIFEFANQMELVQIIADVPFVNIGLVTRFPNRLSEIREEIIASHKTEYNREYWEQVAELNKEVFDRYKIKFHFRAYTQDQFDIRGFDGEFCTPWLAMDNVEAIKVGYRCIQELANLGVGNDD